MDKFVAKNKPVIRKNLRNVAKIDKNQSCLKMTLIDKSISLGMARN